MKFVRFFRTTQYTYLARVFPLLVLECTGKFFVVDLLYNLFPQLTRFWSVARSVCSSRASCIVEDSSHSVL